MDNGTRNKAQAVDKRSKGKATQKSDEPSGRVVHKLSERQVQKVQWVVKYVGPHADIYPIGMEEKKPESSENANVHIAESFGLARKFALDHLTTGVKDYQHSINEVKALRRSKLLSTRK